MAGMGITELSVILLHGGWDTIFVALLFLGGGHRLTRGSHCLRHRTVGPKKKAAGLAEVFIALH